MTDMLRFCETDMQDCNLCSTSRDEARHLQEFMNFYRLECKVKTLHYHIGKHTALTVFFSSVMHLFYCEKVQSFEHELYLTDCFSHCFCLSTN